MIAACLIASTANRNIQDSELQVQDEIDGSYDPIDGPSEEEAYLQGEVRDLGRDNGTDVKYLGEYKTILQLVGVLSHGKVAKRLTDRAIDLMQDVQNLRKAIYEYVRFHSRLDKFTEAFSQATN